MTEAGQPSVKRVISTHEDFQGDEKKSKTAGEDINQGAADPAAAAAAAQGMTPPSPSAMVEEVEEDVEDDDEGAEDARPVATIFHADAGSSNTTQSSLSDENCDSSPALSPDGGGGGINKVTKIPRNISHESGTVNSSLGNRQSSVGNWGWFEEVAHGEAGRGDSQRGGFLPGGPGIKDGGRRRGLLVFGTEIMSSIIPGLGSDRRGEFHGQIFPEPETGFRFWSVRKWVKTLVVAESLGADG